MLLFQTLYVCDKVMQQMENQAANQNFLRNAPLQRLMQVMLRHCRPSLLKAVFDLFLIIVAACWTWFVSFSQVTDPGSPLPFLFVVVTARMALYGILRMDLLSWLNVSRHDVLWIAISAVLGVPLILFIFLILPEPFTLRAMTRPYLLLLTEPALYTLLLCAARITARAVRSSGRGHRRVLLVGAGDAGHAIAFQIQESQADFDIVGFVDDAD